MSKAQSDILLSGQRILYGNDDLIAVYFDGDVMKYVIGAVWRGTEYTYHS